jgi:hypothetical protein
VRGERPVLGGVTLVVGSERGSLRGAARGIGDAPPSVDAEDSCAEQRRKPGSCG